MDLISGKMIGIHRKVHLFDIDIPGKITFKVCMSTEDMDVWA